MRLYPDSKVYILCPGNIASGGPELLHQLCSQLIKFGVNAYMFYSSGNPADPVHEFYRKYHLPYTFEADQSARNVFVVPETAGIFIDGMKKFQRVFWWLSVDNYIGNIIQHLEIHKSAALAAPMPKIFYFDRADNDIDHWVQSEYARQFVKLNGVPENRIYVVEDYLNQEFLSRAAQIDLSRKENFVAFNPRKGFDVTRRLIELAPDISWRPIQNMTPAQVQELLAAAKVYIDFGNHPGKDRIPREAAVSGCVVITGKRGSAGNDIDINIPAEFKFDASDAADDQKIIGKIREVFDDFMTAHGKQADYRARILDDKKRFEHEVAEAFGVKESRGGGAIAQTVSKKTLSLAHSLVQGKEFMLRFIVDDEPASAPSVSGELLSREQNRNYLHVGEQRLEFITREDARFLYREGRIEKFALAEPTDAELADLRTFYAPKPEDVLIFRR